MATRSGLQIKVVGLMCPVLTFSVLVIFVCATVVHFNVTMVTYHHDYKSFESPFGLWTLCADSAFPCTAPPSSLVAANEGNILQVQSKKKANKAQEIHKQVATEVRRPIKVSNPSSLLARHTHHRTQHSIGHSPNGSLGCHGYVVAMQFEEQLCSGVYDLYQLTNVVNTWNMTLVEPYVQGSQFNFHPTPPVMGTSQVLRYRDIFDLEETNRLFSSCLKTDHNVISSFEALVEDAPAISHIIVIYFNRFPSTHSMCELLFDGKALRLKKTITSMLLKHATSSRETNHTFADQSRLVNLIGVPHSLLCVDTRNATNFRDLLSEHRDIKNITDSSILVLIPKWRGIRTSPQEFFYFDPFYKQPSCGAVHAIPNSNKVQMAAQKYRNFLQLERPYIGVHIRLERIIRRSRRQVGYMENCVNEFFRVLQSVLISRNQTTKAVAFSDYSEFGSSTCSTARCGQAAKDLRLDDRLRALGVTVGHFNQSLFSEVSVTGYVAMIELELLSKAERLVTLGHGTFHQRLFHRFYAKQESDWTKVSKWIETGDGHQLFTVCSHK